MATTSLQAELRRAANPAKIGALSAYFKTGPGEYGEGDVFVGISVPDIRVVAKKYCMLPWGDVEELLKSHVHEFRLCAVLTLVYRVAEDPTEHERAYRFYLSHTQFINNWDIVDCSARDIVGKYLVGKSHKVLYDLARSKNMWERRIAVISTAAFINQHQFADTLALCELLLADEHDLMHKACGWMLREVYKQNPTVLEGFLRAHAKHMPRTMLRYAIERMPQPKRLAWLKAPTTRATRTKK
jgi:3-methyladenine DNA glycosylase AlkD